MIYVSMDAWLERTNVNVVMVKVLFARTMNHDGYKEVSLTRRVARQTAGAA